MVTQSRATAGEGHMEAGSTWFPKGEDMDNLTSAYTQSGRLGKAFKLYDTASIICINYAKAILVYPLLASNRQTLQSSCVTNSLCSPYKLFQHANKLQNLQEKSKISINRVTGTSQGHMVILATVTAPMGTVSCLTANINGFHCACSYQGHSAASSAPSGILSSPT